MVHALLIAAQFVEFNPWFPPVQPPPQRFDHATHMQWHVIVLAQPMLDQHCQGHVLACTAHLNGCTTWIDPRYRDYAPLLRHERAHCNGWPGDHPA